MNNSIELNGRTVFHWRGSNPAGFVVSDMPNDARLADVIVAATPNLFVRPGGALCYLTDDGQLIGVNPDRLKAIIGQHVVYVVLMQHNGVWVRVYCEFAFAPRPRFNSTDANRTEPEQLEPDAQTLNDLFRTLLPLRLPRVIGE